MTRLLVVAKAPVPGVAKTRLGVEVGMDVAADLAAAALLDTLAAGAGAFPDRSVALAGDLGAAARAEEINAALDGWTVFRQEGEGFAARLVHAHRVAGSAGDPVVQIGMDTPQVTADLLRAAAAGLDHDDAVLGPAADGGWWLLALRDASAAEVLRDVAMSMPDTGRATARALTGAGCRLGAAPSLRDVDTPADAEAVAAAAPSTGFARAWRRAGRPVGAAG